MNQKTREFKDAMKFWKRKALDAEQQLAVAAMATLSEGVPVDEVHQLK